MPYEIIGRIGRGGMGVVDLATDPQGREVALKRLSLHGTPDELARARQRIRREAEVLLSLDHPGVVGLLDVVDEGDDIVLVMPYLPGGTLAQRVAEHGPLGPAEVAELSDRLLDALAAAHRQGVVHRDLKPANVLFDGEGTPAIADFGVAHHRDATPGLTATETVVGTPGFMAPEQARGEPATAASDVFSLGATLLFAATGEGPYGTGDPRVLMLRAAAGRTERVPRTLPPDLRRRLEAMLQRDPRRRPTAAEARGGTEGGDGTEVRSPVARTSPRARRGLAIAAVAAIAVAAAIGVALAGGDGDGDGEVAASFATTTTEACIDLPYQPCGEEPAPNTDGRACLEGYADYDQDAANGCEAEPDPYDATLDLDDLDGPLEATLVPADDIDTYRLTVRDAFQLNCGGQLRVTLTAPEGVTQRVTVRDGDEERGSAASADGEPATVTVREQDCGGDDGTVLIVEVTSVGSDRSAEPYRLEVSGSF